MIEITNITNDPFQKHVITTSRGSIDLELRYYPRMQFWGLSVNYSGRSRSGLKLALGTLHMRSSNYPFDFIIKDNQGTGIDPFGIDDFASGRCSLFMLERADMEDIRGQSIEI